MSKELTEKWRNGTLEDGDYYVRREDDTIIDYYFNNHWEWIEYEQVVKGVLAKVPTYEEWKAAYECQLMESEEVLTLKQQLKEAKKILYDVWDCRERVESFTQKKQKNILKSGVLNE